MTSSYLVTGGPIWTGDPAQPWAQALVDGFGIPEQLRDAEMLHPERLLEAYAAAMSESARR